MRLFVCRFAALLLVVALVALPGSISAASAVSLAENQAKALFYVLRPEHAHARSNNDPQYYTSLGWGVIEMPDSTQIGDPAEISSRIVTLPATSRISLKPDEEIVWYRLKKMANNGQWWVYGEILEKKSSASPLPDNAATRLVKDMKVGWNLGNSLDSIRAPSERLNLRGAARVAYHETLWNNPVTTKAMVKTVADAGFGAVRVPVTWTNHMDASFRIDSAWLDRVEAVVGYVLDNGMYCIINLHHDVGEGSWPWLAADPAKLATSKKNLRTVWKQIAERFQNYDDRLVFEGFNEILDANSSWSGSSAAAYDAANQLNQVFVDTVRAAPGYNANRFLVVNTYAAGTDSAMLDAFRLPADPAADRLIIGVHCYAPLEFTWPEGQAGARAKWDEAADGHTVESIFRTLRSHAADGVPVIISEFGAWHKGNAADRAKFAAHFVSTARQYGMTAFWWDEGGRSSSAAQVTTATLLDRKNNRWFFPEIVRAMTAAG